MPEYLMEDPTEAERLELKTKRDVVLKELAFLPLEPGLRVLEVGCGTGAVTRILAEKVFPGLVVGLDFSRERLCAGRGIASVEGARNVEFVCGDLFSCGLKEGCFDLVFSRCLFQYFAGERGKEALRRMKSLARPGGRVAVADVDGMCLYRFPEDEAREKALQALLSALEPLGFDAFVGRKLYQMFRQAGLKEIQVDLIPHHLITGKTDPLTRRAWQMKLAILEEHFQKAFGSREEALGWRERFLQDLSDEDVLLYNLMFIVQGTA